MACRRSVKVALNVATASAFFYMGGAWDFQLGTELVAYQFVDSVVAERDPEGVGNPLANGTIGGKALRLLKCSMQLGKVWGCQWFAFAGGNVDGEQRV